MNIDDNIEEFKRYARTFSYDGPVEFDKLKHTLRVVNYAKEIAMYEKLNEEDTYISSLCSLLHDIGRFNQWKRFHNFSDKITLDHGDESCKVLQDNMYILKYTEDKDIQNIVLNACKYHNKYEVPKKIDARVKRFCNIVRDADKIDIINTQLEIHSKGTINNDLIKYIKNHKLCKNKDIHSAADNLIRSLCFIFDLNYKSSFKIIKKTNIIDRYISKISEISNKDFAIEIENEIKKYIEMRLEEC